MGLKRAFETTAEAVEGQDPVGQMYRDLAARTANGGKFNSQLIFSPEAMGDLGADLSAAAVQAAKENIADRIIKLMKDDAAIRKTTQKALNVKREIARSRDGWTEFLNETFRQDLIDNYIKVDDYAKIRELINLP